MAWARQPTRFYMFTKVSVLYVHINVLPRKLAVCALHVDMDMNFPFLCWNAESMLSQA
jgi:hypothetical protein